MGSLATLRLFPTPAELRELMPEDIISQWKTIMKRHCGLRRAEQLISLAKHSIGAPYAGEAYKLHLKQLLEEYDLATMQLQIIEQEILTVLERIPIAKQMLSIKGISAILENLATLVDMYTVMPYYATLASTSLKQALANGEDRWSLVNVDAPVLDAFCSWQPCVW